MSKLSRAAATSQSLSLTAMEEASRHGRREADLEHMLLAVVVCDEPAGRALRGLGVTLAAARDAVEAYHGEQVASLGITAEMPAAGPIVFHETRGYEWTGRASDLLVGAASRGRAGDAGAVLRDLLDEPSGLVVDLLAHLGLDRAGVLRALEAAEAAETTRSSSSSLQPARTGGGRRPTVHAVARTVSTFVPAPVEDVWALVSDPARISVWQPAVEPFDTGGLPVVPGTTWPARSATTTPDGSRARVRPAFRRRSVELVTLAPSEEVAWRFGFPDAVGSRSYLVELHLDPVAGGARLTTTMSWPRRGGWRGAVGVPLRPVQRLVLWFSVFQVGAAVSRAFRHG